MKALTLTICVTILAALVVGTCGCTSSNTPTATPTATPLAAASTKTTTFDPALVKLEAALKAEYPGMKPVQNQPDAGHPTQWLSVGWTLPNGNSIGVTATNDTVTNQTDVYNLQTSPISSGEVLDTANATHFGQSAIPSVLAGSINQQDTNMQSPGTPYLSTEYILYTGSASQNAILFEITQSGPS